MRSFPSPLLARLAAPVAATLALGLLTLLPAAAHAAPERGSTSRGERISDARAIAVRQIGDRYRYGAEGPRRFDCSGLVWFATHRAGLGGVPRTSADQAEHARRIKKKRLRPGDLLFFDDGQGVYHVAIFLRRRDGEVRMLHAPGRGERVRRDSPWTSHWWAGTLRR